MKVENGGREWRGWANHKPLYTVQVSWLVIRFGYVEGLRLVVGFCGIRGRGCEWLEFTITGCGTRSEVWREISWGYFFWSVWSRKGGWWDEAKRGGDVGQPGSWVLRMGWEKEWKSDDGEREILLGSGSIGRALEWECGASRLRRTWAFGKGHRYCERPNSRFVKISSMQVFVRAEGKFLSREVGRELISWLKVGQTYNKNMTFN